MKKLMIPLLAAIMTLAVILLFAPTAESSDPKYDPVFRTVTLQPAKSSAGTGAFIVYDKFGTQYFRINPTNLTFDLLLSGTTFTPTNALTQKFLSGTGVTNVMIIRNGFIVGVTNVP